MDGLLSTVLIIIMIILSGVIYLIDIRFVAYALASGIVGTAVVINLLVSRDYTSAESFRNIGIWGAVYLVNLLIAFKAKSISGIEKFRIINKKSALIVLGITVILFIFNILGTKDMPALMYPILFIFYYIIIGVIYNLLKEFIFSYILLWITYFFGTKKKINKAIINLEIYRSKYRSAVYVDYFLSEYENKKISFNSKTHNRLFKTKEAMDNKAGYMRINEERQKYKIRKNLEVKIVPFINKLIITEVK